MVIGDKLCIYCEEIGIPADTHMKTWFNVDCKLLRTEHNLYMSIVNIPPENTWYASKNAM